MNWLQQFRQMPNDAKRVCGNWFAIRLTPDLASGEVLNVGVAFTDQNGSQHVRLLDEFAGLRCLYGNDIEEETRFLLRLVGRSFERCEDSPSPNISFSTPRYAAGDSIESILDDLFQTVVTLARRNSKRSDQDDPAFASLNTDHVRKVVFEKIRELRGLEAERIIVEQPHYIQADKRRIALDIPLRPGNKIGTLVSACYKTAGSVERHIMRANTDLEAAERHFQSKISGFFVLRPTERMGLTANELTAVDDVLDRLLWKIRRPNIHIEALESTDEIAKEIIAWSN